MNNPHSSIPTTVINCHVRVYKPFRIYIPFVKYYVKEYLHYLNIISIYYVNLISYFPNYTASKCLILPKSYAYLYRVQIIPY